VTGSFRAVSEPPRPNRTRPPGRQKNQTMLWLAKSVATLPSVGPYLADALLRASSPTVVLIPLLFVAGILLLGRWFRPAVATLGALALALVPALYEYRKHRRWLKLIGEQLPYLIELLKSALESGHTLLRALQMAAQNMPDPIRQELRPMVEQVQLGMTVPQALEGMLRRVPLEELRFLVAAVKIQTDVGSGLADVLQHVADSMRSRQRAEHQLRALTAQSRMSALVVTFLPFIVLASLSFINPDYAKPLFDTELGSDLLEVAVVLDVAAFFAMRHLGRVDY